MNRVRFLHIPKTGGTTFSDVFRRKYRGTPRFSFTGDLEFDRRTFGGLPEHARRATRVFTGHAPITTGVPEADTARIITLLRDPIARVQSLCRHIWDGKEACLGQEHTADCFDLERLLGSGHPALDNLQTRMLICGDDHNCPSVFGSMSAVEARDRALENLFERIDSFGLLEYFDESMVLFARALGWSPPFYIPLNTSRKTNALYFPQCAIDRIAELNRIDLEVYETAKKWFLEQMESGIIDPAMVRRFQLAQRMVKWPLRPWVKMNRVMHYEAIHCWPNGVCQKLRSLTVC